MANGAARNASLRSRSWLDHLVLWLARLTAVAMLTACGASEKTGSAEDSAGPAPAAAEVSQPTGAPAVVTTYAGSGSPMFKGDGGPATEAGFFAPTGVAVDGEGNLYISSDKRVRKVDAATGIISTVVGSGSSLTLGDGGAALEAGLREPRGLEVDGLGNLFITDNGTGRIRRVDAATGVITTVAGGGEGNIREKILGDGGLATEALVKPPDDVAVDSAGNLYIATDNRIRKVDGATGIIDTIAGTGDRGVEGDGGPATNATMAEPVSVVLDNQRNIFIVDSENHRIRRVDAATGIMTTVAGIGKHYERNENVYAGLAVGGHYDSTNAPATGAGYAGDGGPASQAMLQRPSGIDVDSEGNLFIADGTILVRRIDAGSGTITTVVAGEVERTARAGKVQVLTSTLREIVSVAVNDAGEIFLADYKSNLVHKVSVPGVP